MKKKLGAVSAAMIDRANAPKHTPGPWNYYKANRSGLFGFVIGNEQNIQVAEAFPLPHTVAVSEENARLIAAAPEQNEALIELASSSQSAIFALLEKGIDPDIAASLLKKYWKSLEKASIILAKSGGR